MESSNKLGNRNFVFAMISVVLFLSTYYVMMPVLPLYMKEMGGNNFEIGLVMGVFSVVSLILRPISGKLGDRRDPVKLLRISAYIFFLTPLCFLAPSFLLVGLAQAIYGFTIGMFTTASGLVVTGSVDSSLISRAIGIHSIAIILAKGVAPTLGSLLYEQFGTMAAVIATLLLAACALLCTFRIAPMQPKAEQQRQSISMVQVFTQRTVWVPSLVLLSVTVTFGAIMTMLPLYAAERGIEQFKLFFTVNTAMVVLVRLVLSKKMLSDNVKIISSLAALVVAVAMVAFCRTLPMLLCAAAIYGYGYGLSYPTLTSFVMVHNAQQTRGTAFGAFTAFFDVGVALGSAFGGLSEYTGFTFIYQAAACIPLIGIVLYVLLLMRYSRGDHTPVAS